MSQDDISNAVRDWIASGHTVTIGPTLYADGCNGDDNEQDSEEGAE